MENENKNGKFQILSFCKLIGIIICSDFYIYCGIILNEIEHRDYLWFDVNKLFFLNFEN